MKEKLSEAVQTIIGTIEGMDFSVDLYEESGSVCGAEIESWTDGGVDMIHFIDLRGKDINDPDAWKEEIASIAADFDIDEEIEIHRQCKGYKEAFTCRASVEDFEAWQMRLRQLSQAVLYPEISEDKDIKCDYCCDECSIRETCERCERGGQITTGAESVLCEMLSCGSMDLKMLDDVEYGWSEILNQADWPRDDLDFNVLMRAVVDVGIIDIREAVNDRICELEAIPNERELDDGEKEELLLLRSLNPDDDIRSYHNCLDTHVWFEKNSDIYRKYLSEALDDFAENTGFEIG